MSRTDRPRTWVKVALVAALFLGLASPPVGAAQTRRGSLSNCNDWPHFHYDNGNTGFNPCESILNPSTVTGLRLLWSVPTSSGLAPTPVVANGLVYVAPADGIVRALDPATGATVWSADTGGPMTLQVAPAVEGTAVYVANDEGVVLSLDAATGTTNWSVDIGDATYGTISVADGLLYAHASYGLLHALDASTGAGIWSGEDVGDAFSLADGAITGENSIGCVVEAKEASTGAQRWFDGFCEIGGVGIPAAVDGLIFAPKDYSVYVIDSATGDFLWEADSGGFGVTSAPAVADGVIYIASDSDLSAQTRRSSLWKRKFSEAFNSSPAVANGVLYIGSRRGRLAAFDASTGELLWASRMFASSFSGSPAVSNGVVYASSEDGRVFAFGLP